MEYQAPKGTHDLLNEDARLFEEVENLMKHLATLYGYVPLRTPIFEHTELFTRSVGESSDIVRKEMYSFLDKGERSLTLRPEMTAGALRAIVNAKLDKTADLPIKLYYSGPAFRYERPQLGRFRQFYQFGVEQVGITSLLNDAETIILGVDILTSLGFKNLVIKVNSLGDESSRNAYRAALKGYFSSHITKMCPDCKERLAINPLRILDCKVPTDQLIAKDAPKMNEYLSPEAKLYLKAVTTILDEYQLDYVLDEGLVRGLDYYSHVVYEYHLSDEIGATYGALGAGGHYDKLLQELGGSPLPGVGFAFGIDRIISIINELKLSPDLSDVVDCFVMPLGETEVKYAYAVTTLLRSTGLRTDLSYEAKSIKAQIKKATRLGAKYALIVGESEVRKETVMVKNLVTQEQVEVALKELINYFEKNSHQCQCDHDHDDDHECHCKEHK